MWSQQTPEIEPILAWPNGRPWEPGRWSYGGHGTTARWIPSKDPQPPEVRLSMEAAEAAAVAASLDEAEVARKMLMWGAQEGPLQATRAEATRASGAVVAAPGNANIGDILEHKRRVWRLLRDEGGGEEHREEGAKFLVAAKYGLGLEYAQPVSYFF